MVDEFDSLELSIFFLVEGCISWLPCWGVALEDWIGKHIPAIFLQAICYQSCRQTLISRNESNDLHLMRQMPVVSWMHTKAQPTIFIPYQQNFPTTRKLCKTSAHQHGLVTLPTPVVAFLSVAPKVAALAFITRIFNILFPFSLDQWHFILEILAISSMILGRSCLLMKVPK
jgi:hypothetical protein